MRLPLVPGVLAMRRTLRTTSRDRGEPVADAFLAVVDVAATSDDPDAPVANARHGVHRRRADLRVVVKAALQKLDEPSDRELALITGVTDKMIAWVRPELVANGELEVSPTRTGNDKNPPAGGRIVRGAAQRRR